MMSAFGNAHPLFSEVSTVPSGVAEYYQLIGPEYSHHLRHLLNATCKASAGKVRVTAIRRKFVFIE